MGAALAIALGSIMLPYGSDRTERVLDGTSLAFSAVGIVTALCLANAPFLRKGIHFWYDRAAWMEFLRGSMRPSGKEQRSGIAYPNANGTRWER